MEACYVIRLPEMIVMITAVLDTFDLSGEPVTLVASQSVHARFPEGIDVGYLLTRHIRDTIAVLIFKGGT